MKLRNWWLPDKAQVAAIVMALILVLLVYLLSNAAKAQAIPPVEPPVVPPVCPVCPAPPVCPVCPPVVPPVLPPVSDCVQKPIKGVNVIEPSAEGGRSFWVRGKYGTPPNNSDNLTRSKVRVFENGAQLGSAHAKHADIKNLGKGRYNHWAMRDGRGESVRFSSTDLSDPRSNGKTYTFCVVR